MCAARGIPLSGRARQFTPASFDGCDYALAMDRSNRAELLRLQARGLARQVAMDPKDGLEL